MTPVPLRVLAVAAVLALPACSDDPAASFDYESICLSNVNAMRDKMRMAGDPTIADLRYEHQVRCCRELAGKASNLPRAVRRNIYERQRNEIQDHAEHMMGTEDHAKAAGDLKPLSDEHLQISLAFMSRQASCFEEAEDIVRQGINAVGPGTLEKGDINLDRAGGSNAIPYED